MSSKPPSTACFSIYAALDPSVLPRVLGVFARLGLVPARLFSTADGRAGRELCIDLQIDGMDALESERVATRLRNIVDVALVLTSEKRLQRVA